MVRKWGVKVLTLVGFKETIENILGRSIENADLLKAIQAAKDDVVVNKLIMGEDVTADQFQVVVANCIKLKRCS